MNNCIWCGAFEKLEIKSLINFKSYPIFKGGIFIHDSCNTEFMTTLMAMARRERDQGRF